MVEKEEFLQTFSKECEYIRYSYYFITLVCCSGIICCLWKQCINCSYGYRDVVTNGNAIKCEGTDKSDPAVEVICLSLFFFVCLCVCARVFETFNSYVNLSSGQCI